VRRSASTPVTQVFHELWLDSAVCVQQGRASRRFEEALSGGFKVLGDFLVGQVAQAALAAGGATVGGEWEGRAQSGAEFGVEVAVSGVVLKNLFGLGAEPGDEILHLAAVLALPGGVDQAVEAIHECSVASVDLGVGGLITAFPAQRAHVVGSMVYGDGIAGHSC
jgi:hypothetical protein